MLSAQGARGTGTARLVPRPLQSPATSLCRAEAQEIRSAGHTEVRARVRSGFHTLTLWSCPSAVPSRCLWLQQHLREDAAPSPQGKMQPQGYRGRKLLVCHRKCAHRRTDQLYKLAWISALQVEAGPSHLGILEVGR